MKLAARWRSLQVVVYEQLRADVRAHVSLAAAASRRAPVVAELQAGELTGEAAVDHGSGGGLQAGLAGGDDVEVGKGAEGGDSCGAAA